MGLVRGTDIIEDTSILEVSDEWESEADVDQLSETFSGLISGALALVALGAFVSLIFEGFALVEALGLALVAFLPLGWLFLVTLRALIG